MLGELVDLLQQAGRHVRVHGEVVDPLPLGAHTGLDDEAVLVLLGGEGVRVDVRSWICCCWEEAPELTVRS